MCSSLSLTPSLYDCSLYCAITGILKMKWRLHLESSLSSDNKVFWTNKIFRFICSSSCFKSLVFGFCCCYFRDRKEEFNWKQSWVTASIKGLTVTIKHFFRIYQVMFNHNDSAANKAHFLFYGYLSFISLKQRTATFRNSEKNSLHLMCFLLFFMKCVCAWQIRIIRRLMQSHCAKLS